MADARRYSASPQLDIKKIISEAKSRWLRPAEICEILRNYKSFRIDPEPPNRPPSGSLFLFDKKVLRYFRKDGHNWRKKKDGKTVKEAHEKLKDGSIDVLHCYYAHGEDNEKFQRRTYWMLEQEYTHIALVHYREVQSSRATAGQSAESEELSRNINIESPASSNSLSNHHFMPSRAADTESPNSSHTYEYEDPELDNHQASSRYHPHFELQQFEYGPLNATLDPYLQNPTGYHVDHFSRGHIVSNNIPNDMKFQSMMNCPPDQVDISWDRVLEHCTAGSSDLSLVAPFVSPQPVCHGKFSSSEPTSTGESFQNEAAITANTYAEEPWEVENVESVTVPKRVTDYSILLKQLSLDIQNREGETGLKKYDSFTRWMSKELGEVDESHIKTGSSIYWDTIANEGMSHNEDAYILEPSLSQDQLYSILDFTPNYSFTGRDTMVRVMGKFLVETNEAYETKWSCMFGEVEVPALVSGDGILLCVAPPHKSGRVPFYVTCSNRLACSEVREFEYLEPSSDALLEEVNPSQALLHARLEKLLSLDDESSLVSVSGERLQLSNKIGSFLREDDDEWSIMLRPLKEKLHSWLQYKIADDGKGPSVLDEYGQGVIHLAAALGYDWAITPTIIAGVSIDFRDAHGWTALHWAAFCGREKTVGMLFSVGASPGALTDPTPELPSGRTPADLAASNGHKGIAGFLAETSLTKHLSTLTLKEEGTSDVGKAARWSPVRAADDSGMEAGLSAVRNAAQAMARIHQVFRNQSFQRKKMEDEYGMSKSGVPNERALSLLGSKSHRVGHQAEPVAAAIQIQKKFRGWKGRKDFLTFRQHVVRIQAHVRGHQVRKHYKKIVWTVGIVEKAILRWRRRGPGLRRLKPEGSMAPVNVPTAKEDDYDFLKEGRKQTEARLTKALDRVKSMVQYPEARDQYRRLLTVVDEFQESRVVLERVLNDPEVVDSEPMFDIDELLGEDAFMSMT
ncbi:signal responsive 1 isoform X2 [Wolffia australiana]